MPAKLEKFKQDYRRTVRATFSGLGRWWLDSPYKRLALSAGPIVAGSGRFFLGASLRRTLLELELLSLLVFLLSGNRAIIPDYRLIAITYLPGAVLATIWAALRLQSSTLRGWWRRLGRVLGTGLLAGLLLVGSALLLSLPAYRLEDLAAPTLPNLIDYQNSPESVQVLAGIFLFLFSGPGSVETGTPWAVILVIRLLFYVVEISLFFSLFRLVVALLAIPGGWLKRLGERRLLWRLTFSHFWVVVASLATAIICWFVFLGILTSISSGQSDLQTSGRETAALQARNLAQAIAQEQQANGNLSPGDLEAFLKNANQQNLLNQDTLHRLQSQLPPRAQNLLGRMSNSNFTNTDFLVITDPQGKVIASSNPQRFQPGNNITSGEPAPQRQAGWRQLVGRAAQGEQALDQLALAQAYPGIFIAGAYPVVDRAGTVTMVALVAEQSLVALNTTLQALAPLIVFGVVFVLAAVLTSVFSLLVALVFGYLLSRRLVGNLERLELATDALAAGQLEQRVKIEAEDEIGRLAARFNLMAYRLKESQTSLAREKQKAEEALQTRRELVANVSHELRTPVSTIRAHVDWLLMALEEERARLNQVQKVAASPKSPEYPLQEQALVKGVEAEELRQYLEIIERETERLGSMIEDLLDLSRVEAQGLIVQLGPVDLAELADEVKQRLGQVAQRERKITLVLDIAPNLPPALADRTRLEQVVENLTRNAINYTPAGGIISLGARQSDANHVSLWVADTGMGIAPEELERVFERFYRTDASRSRHTGGAGLGLAIVKTLVEAMGGAIEAESVVGEGSKFTVTLPVATA